jgi:glycosyltransferase involved in cell wall biosynthesis
LELGKHVAELRKAAATQRGEQGVAAADGDAGKVGKRLLVLATLPPPIHGQRVVNQFFHELLSRHACVRHVEIDSRETPASKVAGLARGIFSLWAGRSDAPACAYLSPLAGKGLVLSAVLAAVAKWLGYRVFVHHHSFAYVDHPALAMRLLCRVVGDGAEHICLGPAMVRGLRRRYGEQLRTIIISNALLRPPRRRREARGCSLLRLGHLSNLTLEKGLGTVISSACLALEAGLDVELHIAGPATNKAATKVLEEARSLLGDRLRYHGPLYGSQKHEFFEQLDVFVYPTRYRHEAQPLVVLEALAHGVPVAATSRGCIRDDVADAGLVVADGQAFEQLFLAWLRGLDRSALERLQTRAIKRSRELHVQAQKQFHTLIDGLEMEVSALIGKN